MLLRVKTWYSEAHLLTVRHEEMINVRISLEGERVKNWGDGCVRYRFALRTIPQPCLEAPSRITLRVEGRLTGIMVREWRVLPVRRCLMNWEPWTVCYRCELPNMSNNRVDARLKESLPQSEIVRRGGRGLKSRCLRAESWGEIDGLSWRATWDYSDKRGMHWDCFSYCVRIRKRTLPSILQLCLSISYLLLRTSSSSPLNKFIWRTPDSLQCVC